MLGNATFPALIPPVRGRVGADGPARPAGSAASTTPAMPPPCRCWVGRTRPHRRPAASSSRATCWARWRRWGSRSSPATSGAPCPGASWPGAALAGSYMVGARILADRIAGPGAVARHRLVQPRTSPSASASRCWRPASWPSRFGWPAAFLFGRRRQPGRGAAGLAGGGGAPAGGPADAGPGAGLGPGPEGPRGHGLRAGLRLSHLGAVRLARLAGRLPGRRPRRWAGWVRPRRPGWPPAALMIGLPASVLGNELSLRFGRPRTVTAADAGLGALHARARADGRRGNLAAAGHDRRGSACW